MTAGFRARLVPPTTLWFRRAETGRFAWTDFGDNERVLKWVIERLEGTADAVEAPIGYVPTSDALDRIYLDMTPADVEAAVQVDAVE